MTARKRSSVIRNGVAGKIIHSTCDHLGNLLVIDYRDYRVLTFDSDYTQSGYSLAKPYAVTHEYIRIMMLVLGLTTPRHVTLLGLGGGSLLRSMHHHLNVCDFNVVELRAKVIEIAQIYFDLPEGDRVKYTCADANQHLDQAPSKSSDIIFSDLFDAYFMSPVQVKPVFVEQCYRVLGDRGWLVINFHHLPLSRSAFFTALTAHFQKIFVFSGAADNHIVFAKKSADIDWLGAEQKINNMELELGTAFMSLFEQLKLSQS
ncbi:MAG TPA: methyltransferase domain-containing protein [Cellvibrionaceae bacterium]